MKSFALSVCVAGLFINFNSPAATTNIFFTQFEGPGYNIALDLVGQSGWQGEGSGGNGLMTNVVAGQGQQAYIGIDAPNPGDDKLFIWQPIDFNPIATGYPIVKFSVLMSIENSTNGEQDNFRWSIFNSSGDRLFVLDFDNFDRSIKYKLDGTNILTDTGWVFARSVDYELSITMNFASNRWSAALNDTVIVPSQPITTTNAARTLGDIDATWFPYDTNAPGNNFMLFDDYRITAETIPVPPAQLQFFGRTTEGWPVLRVFGVDGSRWALEATTNFVNWTAFKTNVVSGAYFTEVDTNTAGPPRRFYRARLVP